MLEIRVKWKIFMPKYPESLSINCQRDSRLLRRIKVNIWTFVQVWQRESAKAVKHFPVVYFCDENCKIMAHRKIWKFIFHNCCDNASAKALKLFGNMWACGSYVCNFTFSDATHPHRSPTSIKILVTWLCASTLTIESSFNFRYVTGFLWVPTHRYTSMHTFCIHT